MTAQRERDTKGASAHHPQHLVVVGSSAGGIEALGVLVSSLPEGFPAPIVLAQHLDPSRPSQLAGILERRTVLPVVTVEAHTPLETGKVFVVPSNRHVVIRDGSVELEDDHGERPRPSVDLLLTTAARVYGEKLVAVILTGSGSDGAAGAVEVKEHGGTVVIQNPRTAAHPSMPAALPPTAVDHVCDLEEIGPMITEILRGDTIRERIDKADRGALDDVLELVTQQSNIDFRQYKSTTITRRISRRMAINRVHSLEEYRDFLVAHPDETADLARSLLIKVTEFFRDAEAFSLLEQEVLPKIIERGRERGRVLRLWSAGCATGEESYSLALLLAHMLGRELPEWSVKIFATDVDETAVSFARRGTYPSNVLRNLSAEYRTRYFEPLDQGHRVAKTLRQMIIFGQQDLGRGAPFPRIDLVVCRNLLIYFKPELQQAVLDLFAYSLHQTRGYLFLGKAETARPTKATFDLINKKWKIYQCVGGPQAIVGRPTTSEPREAAGITAVSDADRAAERADEPELRRSNEMLLRYLPFGICVIDRAYRIISLNGAARRLLGIRDAATEQDFLHTARGLPYVEARAAIDRAFRGRALVELPSIEMGAETGEGRFVRLQIVPVEGTSAERAIVVVENVSELVQTRRRLEAVESEQSQLAEEVGAANQRLLEMNKDLQDANEELQAANEEMMLAHEELQATNEEFEATNEELQATNEELETNSEEVQSTNEELETTNEELQARTSELQELTRILSGERRRLTEVVEQAPFQIMVLRGPGLVVESLSPNLAALFEGGRPVNRSFEEVCADPALGPIRTGVRRAFQEDRMWRSEPIPIGSDEAERWLQFTAVPTHALDGSSDGAVVYVENVALRGTVPLTSADRSVEPGATSP